MEFVSHYGNGRGQKVGLKDEGLFHRHNCHNNFGDEVTNTWFDHFLLPKEERPLRGNASLKVACNKIERRVGR